MRYSAYGMNDASVLYCLNRYRFGALEEIIESIEFCKGQFTFTFRKPLGFASWRQWLYKNDQYQELSSLLKALHKSDDMDSERLFLDDRGDAFARIDDDKPWHVQYLK